MMSHGLTSELSSKSTIGKQKIKAVNLFTVNGTTTNIFFLYTPFTIPTELFRLELHIILFH
ncbi:MAG: hypothetical protein Kow0037_31900 [Calditrichia bacterium]